MADIVIREVTENVWTFSKPFTRFGFLPFGGRSTAIKLKSGNVWVMASTPLSPETKETIDKLGPVKYIVGADAVHYLYLKEFQDGYPEAKVYAVQEAAAKTAATLDGAWGGENGPADFEDEILTCYFSGFVNKDVVFFHKPSKVIVEADLLVNLPAKEQYSKVKTPWASSLFGSFNPYSALHRKSLGGQVKDKAAMKEAATIVAGWDFDKIIPCHGDVIESDGNKAWRTLYADYL